MNIFIVFFLIVIGFSLFVYIYCEILDNYHKKILNKTRKDIKNKNLILKFEKLLIEPAAGYDDMSFVYSLKGNEFLYGNLYIKYYPTGGIESFPKIPKEIVLTNDIIEKLEITVNSLRIGFNLYEKDMSLDYKSTLNYK